MATITYGHHALLASKRDAAILGTLLTIILALIFTGLQAFEYAQSSITIADSVFGSAFFCATGLHGWKVPLSINFNSPKKRKKILNNYKYSTNFPIKQDNLTLLNKNKEYFNINKNFLEWLAGFTDSEGNFSITLRYKNITENSLALDDSNLYSNITLTFQIGLHLDDLKALELIKKNLHCGKISISEVNNKCNFFVNDAFSLINIIVPIFNFVQLNSSKFSQFKIFEEAVKLLNNKSHLTLEGKTKMIDYKKKLNKDYKVPDYINITEPWLLGFIEGDGSFSTSGIMPRLKFENHIKELKLLQEIQKFIGYGSVIIKTRKDRGLNENPTAVLEINKIIILKIFVDKYDIKNSDLFNFYTKKYFDFKDWSIIVNLYYLGYHLLPEGKSLITKIKTRMNNYRLTTNTSLTDKEKLENLDVEKNKVFALTAPYEIKNGIRLYSGTNKWVSDNIKVIVIYNLGNDLYFDSISKCSLSLKISRSKIKDCIVKGKLYKNFAFKLNLN